MKLFQNKVVVERCLGSGWRSMGDELPYLYIHIYNGEQCSTLSESQLNKASAVTSSIVIVEREAQLGVLATNLQIVQCR
jgi:hypothetical protein